MSIRDDLLKEIDGFLRSQPDDGRIAESTFGRLAVNDGKFVGRLRRGEGVTIDTVDRVRRFIADRQRAAA